MCYLRYLFVCWSLMFVFSCAQPEVKQVSPLQVKIASQSKATLSSSSQKISQEAPPPPLVEPKKPQGFPDLNKPVTITAKDASLKQILISLAKQMELNIVIDENVEDSKVNVSFNHVPFGQVLRAILTSQDLYFKVYPNYIRVSKMVTKFFHIDYVVSVREGLSNTKVSLSSGTDVTEGTSGAEGVSQSSSSGDISIISSEVVNFWANFERGLKEILKDPLYNILQTEYNRKLLKQQLGLLPYQEEYQKEMQKQQIEMLSLQKQILKKRLEEGEISDLSAISGMPGTTGTIAATTAGTTETAATTATTEATEQLVGSYTVDPQTGTVVVTTTPQIMENVEKFIAKVKQELSRQVLIDVQILEVNLTSSNQIGIDWSKFPGTIEFYKMPRMRSVINSLIEQQAETSGGGTGSVVGQGGVYSPLMTSPFPSSPSGSLQVGILHTLTPSVAYQWSNEALISFLQTQGTVKAISRPQLLTLNNQPAIVSVGVNDFYVTYEQATTSAQAGLATSTVTSKLNPLFIGVTLNITPQISTSGEIILKIVPAINKKIGEKAVPTGIPSAPVQSIPIVETRQTSTIVKARDGQPVIISGLIQEEKDKVFKKVPVLGNVPILGHVFRYKEEKKVRSELVIVLTPHLQLSGNKDLGYQYITNDGRQNKGEKVEQ
ncbi:MAG: secretin N-terminal domain-containing protein [Candidatus Desulfofervidaceae bacterium]|nr:secretin N-terminal domain-containing protein [Candidatus Desulfofervidaceae bacterium]